MDLFENVACTVCGCVCDDLRIGVEAGKITHVEPHCPLAEAWFLGQDQQHPALARIDGQPVALPMALDRAAEILQTAVSPLVYGLSRSCTEGQRAAIALAERAGATIDTTASLCHATSMMAIQEVGESTCTLGEIKNRADLVIYWGSNPVESHPRHLERYAVFPPGRFVPEGRAGRTLIVVDVKPTPTSALADHFVSITPGSDFEVLHALRALVAGVPLEETDHGAPLPVLRDLAQRMKECKFGVVFFGLGLSMRGSGHRNVEALLLLVRDLNHHARFFARRMRVQGDVTGADTVLLWQTGYPFGVNLSRGHPRYNPGEFTANELLEREDVDACLLLGSEGVARFSVRARAHLQRIPTICLDYPNVEPPLPCTVRFTTAVHGVHRPGTVYRMDGVPIPLRGFLPTTYPSDAEVLAEILARVNGPLLPSSPQDMVN